MNTPPIAIKVLPVTPFQRNSSLLVCACTRKAGLVDAGDDVSVIGRNDFPRGNYTELTSAIRGRLVPLGGHVQFVPGHGPASTFGTERASNPHLANALFAPRSAPRASRSG